MLYLNSFIVPVSTQNGIENAHLQPVEMKDLLKIEDLPSWGFAWTEIRQKTSSDCQGIIQIHLNNQCLGLIRFGLYPYPGVFQYVEIEQLEVHPYSRGNLNERLAKPVGKWLIWYAINAGLNYHNTEDDKTFVFLHSFEESFEYYRDQIKMELVGSVAISPSEDGYAFRFILREAKRFCQRIEEEYGVAKKQSA